MRTKEGLAVASQVWRRGSGPKRSYKQGMMHSDALYIGISIVLICCMLCVFKVFRDERLHVFPEPYKLLLSTYLYSIEQGTKAKQFKFAQLEPTWNLKNLNSKPHRARSKPHSWRSSILCRFTSILMLWYEP